MKSFKLKKKKHWTVSSDVYYQIRFVDPLGNHAYFDYYHTEEEAIHELKNPPNDTWGNCLRQLMNTRKWVEKVTQNKLIERVFDSKYHGRIWEQTEN